MTDSTSTDGRRIVVGVDGSKGSRTALTWALDQARLTGATVEAVTAWQDPVMLVGYGYPIGGTGYIDGDSIAAITQKTLDDTVAALVAERGEPVDVHTRTVMGHPAQVLTDAADGARLLVVGSRGHGTFAGVLLGSVSQHCVQHAPCPVVVVPQ